MIQDGVIMKEKRCIKFSILLGIILGSFASTFLMCIILRLYEYSFSKDYKFLSKVKLDSKVSSTYVWSIEAQEWSIRRFLYETLEVSHQDVCIWPECSERTKNDRIINQLMLKTNELNRYIKIKPPDYSYPTNQQVFLDEECLINKCLITYDDESADVLIFQNADVTSETLVKNRRQNQIWIAYLLESPIYTFDRRFERVFRGKQKFNWTASYRSDSDLVTPYSKFVPFEDKIIQYLSLKESTKNHNKVKVNKLFTEISEVHRNILKGKSLSVVWFASNCNSANSRMEYAKELSNYIQVDIYGKCGNMTCDKWNQSSCLNMISRKYFFYLSFENSNCREYITEKLYKNAFGYNELDHFILPIVMGPPREDYEKLSPPASFIHVNDFESPKELAEYLKLLESDMDRYYSYFQWKFVGQFIDTKFFCRVCALAHQAIETDKTKSYSSIKDWWNRYGGADAIKNSSLLSKSCIVNN